MAGTEPFRMKRGDTRPYMRRQIKQTNDDGTPGPPVTLENVASIKLLMKLNDTIKQGAVDIIDVGEGIVERKWQSADTTTVGEWTCELQLTYSDGGIETVPPQGGFKVLISEDIPG